MKALSIFLLGVMYSGVLLADTKLFPEKINLKFFDTGEAVSVTMSKLDIQLFSREKWSEHCEVFSILHPRYLGQGPARDPIVTIGDKRYQVVTSVASYSITDEVSSLVYWFNELYFDSNESCVAFNNSDSTVLPERIRISIAENKYEFSKGFSIGWNTTTGKSILYKPNYTQEKIAEGFVETWQNQSSNMSK